MGRKAPTNAPVTANWGTPPYLNNAQILVSYWVKVIAWDDVADQIGPRHPGTSGFLIQRDDANDRLRLLTLSPFTTYVLSGTGFAGSGWRHVGFYSGSGVTRTFTDGVTVAVDGNAFPTASDGASLDCIIHKSGYIVAEVGIWWKASGLTDAVGQSIMAQLAAQSPKEANLITDLPVDLYAPGIGHFNDIIGPITATDGTVDAADHPWAVGSARFRRAWSGFRTGSRQVIGG